MTNKAFRLQLLMLAVLLLVGTMPLAGCIVIDSPSEGEAGMSPEGWCCRNGDVFPCPEHECYDTGGDFFATEHEAVAHCGGQMPPGEGWCCDGGNVSPCSEDECHSWGGAFFLYEHEAIAHCGGQMPPGEGWCCDAGNVAPCSEAECLSWGGAFFLYEHEAIAHCQGTTPGPSPGPAPAGLPVINYFTANPSPITGGQSSTLKWDVSGANTVGLTAPGFKVLNPLGTTDQLQVSPTATKVYTLTATNSAGTVTDTATVTVTGSAPPAGLPVINYFTANPSTITAGQSTTLKWDTSRATSVALDWGIGKVGPAGTISPAPVLTVVYQLTATNSAGTATATVKVTVK